MDATVCSAERADEIENASITEGYVNDAGHLVLKNKAGSEADAGPISLLGAYPIGAVYIGTEPTSPALLFGGGTWERFAKGKVLVGLDEADPDFDTVLETRGEKTHLLTEDEMPSHDHGGWTGDEDTAHFHTPFSNDGAYVKTGTGVGGSTNMADTGSGLSVSLAPSTHTNNTGHLHPISSAGGDNAHNNIQPSIVVFMWRRTA